MDIEDVLDKAGIPWPTRDRKIVCPFHEDSSPSMHIYDDDWGGHGYCFTCDTWANGPMLLKQLTGEEANYKTGTTAASVGVSAHKVRGAASKRLRELSMSFFPAYEQALPAEVRGFAMGQAADEFQIAQWDVLDEGITGYEAEQLVRQMEELCDMWLGNARRLNEWLQVQRTELGDPTTGDGRYRRRRIRPRLALGKE